MLANSIQYFVRNIGVYQRKNVENINIHARYANLPSTIKEVVNGTITVGVGNDPDGAIKLF